MLGTCTAFIHASCADAAVDPFLFYGDFHAFPLLCSVVCPASA
jgi:hypothetical protein